MDEMEWIEAEEHPKYYGVYIVNRHDIGVTTDIYNPPPKAWVDLIPEMEKEGYWCSHKVTHWMPMPPAPK